MKLHLFLWQGLAAPFFLGELQGCYLACHLEFLSQAKLEERKALCFVPHQRLGFLCLPEHLSPLSLTK